MTRGETIWNTKNQCKQKVSAALESETSVIVATAQNHRRGWCRIGRLQKTRPLAFTKAAMPVLKLAHIIEKNNCQKSLRTVN